MKQGKNLLNLAKENICHLYPKVIFIDVNMIRLTNNQYRCKIILKTRTKSYFADKEANNYKESLDKSCGAIKKQLERAKIDRAHRPRKKATFEEDKLLPSIADAHSAASKHLLKVV